MSTSRMEELVALATVPDSSGSKWMRLDKELCEEIAVYLRLMGATHMPLVVRSGVAAYGYTDSREQDCRMVWIDDSPAIHPERIHTFLEKCHA